MTRRLRDLGAVLGFGAAACAACCAPLVIGAVAAIGAGTAILVLGGSLLAAAGIALALWLTVGRRRRNRAASEPVPVTLQRHRGGDPVSTR